MNSNQNSFYGLGIAPGFLEVLNSLRFTTPTPIQHKAIPVAIEGKDIIGIAQTGTGKTLAFGIPMIQQLAQKRGRGLILVPTRELAVQVNDALKRFVPVFKMKTAVLIGGESMNEQTQALRHDPRIIVATPGRLLDHVMQHHVRLDDIVVLVLDEADRMLDMGFAPQVEKILMLLPRQRQTMLFSATMPAEIMKMINTYMQLPVHVEMAPSGTTAEGVTQELYIVKREAKISLLSKILSQYQGSVLLFIRTKHSAHKIVRSIREMGHRVAEIHSDKSLPQRREALEGFKSGRYRVLVATDIASRGIDVTKIEVVINYDLPEDVENYVHRIGRTARAGCKGRAISFATPDQKGDVKNIEQLIRKQLPIVKHPEIPAEEFEAFARPAPARGVRRGFGSQGYRPRQGGGHPSPRKSSGGDSWRRRF